MKFANIPIMLLAPAFKASLGFSQVVGSTAFALDFVDHISGLTFFFIVALSTINLVCWPAVTFPILCFFDIQIAYAVHLLEAFPSRSRDAS